MKIFSLISLLLITIICQAQIVPIPDPSFKIVLLNHDPPVDTNGDGEIQVSEAEATINLDLLHYQNFNISSLEGIEYFVNLETLRAVGWHLLESIDISQNVNIVYLNLVACNVSSVDVSQNPDLVYLALSHNPISTLDISNNLDLERLFCFNCELTNVTVGNNTNLETFYVLENNLTSLRLSELTGLKELEVGDNQLTVLDIKNGNNSGMHTMKSRGNPDLLCIQVDDEAATYPECDFTGWCISSWTSYSEDCLYLDIEDHQRNFSTLFPNPATDVVIFFSETAIIDAIAIYSATGTKVLDRAIDASSNSVDISLLNSGLYFVEIASADRKEVHKIIKN